MIFEIYRGMGGLWYWRMKSRNNRVIADGSEGYIEKRKAIEAAERIIAGAGSASVEVKD